MLIESIYIAAVKKTVLVGVSEFGASLVGAILAFYIYGGFYHIGSTSVNGGGLGHLGANLNALFNPLETGLYLTGWSKFMKTKPVAELGQYEGYSYLGLGLMLLLIIAIAGVLAKGGQWIKEQWNALRVEIIYICCAGVLLLVASFGTDITLNDRTLLHIPYPDFFLKIYGIFRSTGRFMWGVWDLVVIATLVVSIGHLPLKWQRSSLSHVCCCRFLIFLRCCRIELNCTKIDSKLIPLGLRRKI